MFAVVLARVRAHIFSGSTTRFTIKAIDPGGDNIQPRLQMNYENDESQLSLLFRFASSSTSYRYDFI
jgi:hypothetical protein